ncbi:Twinfilin-1 [Cryptotrichosporon argae]
MSAPSGIKVPPALTAAFASAQADAADVRALVFVIEGEAFTHLTTLKPSGSYKDDISLLAPALPSPKMPASFAYRLDTKEGGRYEWMMVTFVPDDAGIRAKMLQASSRAGLLKALGANFKHDWYATNVNDLTPAALAAHLSHMSAPPPLTASEAALAEVKAAEADEARRAALDADLIAARKQAVVGLTGKTSLGAGVQAALEQAAKRSDDGWVVVLQIAQAGSGIELVTSSACEPAQLAFKLPEKQPAYVFYSFPTPPPPAPAVPAPAPAVAADRNTFHASEGGARPAPVSWAPKTDEPASTEGDADGAAGAKDAEAEAGERASPKAEEPAPAPPTSAPAPETKGRVVFIYWCPAGSPVKFRMVYSTTVRSIQQDARDKAGVEIAAKIETSDLSDLTDAQLKAALPLRPTHAASLPTPSSAASSASPARFGAPAPSFSPTPAFGGAFGRPMPAKLPVRSATQIPLPASGPATPVGGAADEDDDSKERIKSAFDAFGPRVGAGASGGFARPRPAGRR